ncbi:hypothetical protein BKP37_18865 [Anaerobacillus alkalilacustris]|uniref:DUF4309 domain-containing protein n=1 Tax=Anaerobacillus alkalilacustris TaxID=393763 RepID=A0A1S2LE49_9BACI|nr:DUF4309 domain-containing protein [Anaerobacillus alkalilacustris]OIJ10594.1 hypothetical protein BKP37_18865 [Anaerobacillus alkalilacustris]
MKQILFVICWIFLVACGTNQETNLHHLEDEYSRNHNIYISSSSENELVATLLNISPDNDENLITTSNNNYFTQNNLLKEIKEGIFQTIITEKQDNHVRGISFYTWIENEDEIIILDKVKFTDDVDLQLGQFYSDIWHENNKFYLSYHDLDVTSSFITEALTGRMVTSPIIIGSSKNEVILKVGEPSMTDWYLGGTYYYYNDMAYLFDEASNVVAINMPGLRINVQISEVIEKLGAPTNKSYSEMENSYYYSYEAGPYLLSFEVFDKDKNITNIWLTKSNNFLLK